MKPGTTHKLWNSILQVMHWCGCVSQRQGLHTGQGKRIAECR